jgi:hypothetical protein
MRHLMYSLRDLNQPLIVKLRCSEGIPPDRDK